ncbi:roadblock/LC7 domain-containing protein [Streptomyces sp. MBT59]|uniref:roadblock/LC7 domain-containing protein n=1 Tax=Streptomyces sp. MBT59 TaxID=1488390 RepID=UPI001F3F0373|nr:roadblock/LC7 domain-containing protein [Streptomyces sp. MBT59]
MTATTDEKLNWLLEGLLDRTPGTRHALVLSRDGLKLCRTPELSVDQADQLAAISAGIQSLSHGASIEFGDGTGGVRSAMAEFYGGVLFIVEAGAGAHRGRGPPGRRRASPGRRRRSRTGCTPSPGDAAGPTPPPSTW